MTDNTLHTVLLTGATGFIGSHVRRALSDMEVHTLSRAECDLERQTPVFTRSYDAVVHVAGTDEAARADALNNEGTKRLLKSLEAFPPRTLTLISTVHVYGRNPGEEVAEDTFLRPDTEYARSKIRAEKECESWCAAHGVPLTILRPALVAGSGMHGRLAEMAAAVRQGRYFHIRGNVARRSLVMACDVAKAVRLTLGLPGVYNVCDGYNRTVRELADAMTRNFGTDKRLLTVPLTPLKLFATVARVVTPLRSLISAEKLQTLTASATFSNRRLTEATGMKFYDTVEVIARRDTDYPYEDE